MKYELDPTVARMGPIRIEDVVVAVNERLSGLGRARAVNDKRLAIDVYGDLDPVRMTFVKQRISAVGEIEFCIVADPRHVSDRSIIDAATSLRPNEKVVELDEKRVAEWVPYAAWEFGPVDGGDDRAVKRLAGNVPEALVLIDPLKVTGEYLTSATKGIDARGGPAVNFTLNRQGARLFGLLTSENTPNQTTGAVRHLGILFDKRLISAPGIHATIRDRGQISGGAMTNDEVDSIIAILNAGRLPHPIREVVEN